MEALTGNFRPRHALIVPQFLAHLDYLDETIAEISQEVEELLAPLARKTELLATIDGVAVRNAQVILAELGPDMSRFPSDRNAASSSSSRLTPYSSTSAMVCRSMPAAPRLARTSSHARSRTSLR
jgi:transposase